MKKIISILLILLSMAVYCQTNSQKYTEQICNNIIQDLNGKIIDKQVYDNTRMYIIYNRIYNIDYIIDFFNYYTEKNNDIYSVETWEYKDILQQNGYYATYCFYNELVSLVYYNSKLLIFRFDYDY
jgi:hypothetical protein